MQLSLAQCTRFQVATTYFSRTQISALSMSRNKFIAYVFLVIHLIIVFQNDVYITEILWFLSYDMKFGYGTRDFEMLGIVLRA